MDFIKQTLNQVDMKDSALYNAIYDLFFFAKLKESEENIKSGNFCSLEELKQYINKLEASHENTNIK